MKETQVFTVFLACVKAITQGILISRVSSSDKEFHFQNWFENRLAETERHYDKGGRNSYPDFRLVEFPEGYEVKALAWPGRESSYDCNSQPPTGHHNGRDIYYVFGRYPKAGNDTSEYPVIDFVICHGDFLNADHTYVHKNRSVKSFGSYGDILIRDRKMYVAPTPFAIANGLATARTLILPDSFTAPGGFVKVGSLVRVEANHLVVGYDFDLRSNTIEAKTIPNPAAGREHCFFAYRSLADPESPVTLAGDSPERSAAA